MKSGWRAVDGVLEFDGKGPTIMTTEEFGDFDLRFEWKVAGGANSGVKYFIIRERGSLGHEYQVLDDEQAWANDYLARTHCNEVNREVMLRGLPLGLRGTPGTINTLGPELGQDPELILFETLRYDWDRIGELKSSGAIL